MPNLQQVLCFTATISADKRPVIWDFARDSLCGASPKPEPILVLKTEVHMRFSRSNFYITLSLTITVHLLPYPRTLCFVFCYLFQIRLWPMKCWHWSPSRTFGLTAEPPLNARRTNSMCCVSCQTLDSASWGKTLYLSMYVQICFVCSSFS